MKGSLNSTYHLIDEMTDKEYKGFREKVKQWGGTFIYQNLQKGNAFCVVKSGDAASRIKFEYEFRQTAEYRLTKEYEMEQKVEFYSKAINEGCFHWSEEYLETLFYGHGSDTPEQKDDSWELLVILLNEGLLRVRVEDYPVVPIPRERTQERLEYERFLKKQEDSVPGYLAWCGRNWLNGKGEKQPAYDHSKALLVAPELKMAMKLGEGNPYQIIYKILEAEDWNTYVHLPYGPLNKLYIFEATELFYHWLQYHRYGSHFEEPSMEQKLLSSYIYHLRGSVKLRRDLAQLVAKQQKGTESGAAGNKGLLDEYDEGTLFELEDAVKIIQDIKDGEISVELLEILINQGVLKAQRIRDIWVVSKQNLLDYLEATEVQEEAELETKPAVAPPLKVTPAKSKQKSTVEGLTLEEVSEFIKNHSTNGRGIAPTIRTIKHLIRTGELKAQKRNNNWLVTKQDLEKYLQSQQKAVASYKKKKEVSEKASSKQNGWTDTMDQILVKHVLDGLMQGKKFDEIFRDGIKEIGMDGKQCKNRWYMKWSYKCRHDVAKIKEEASRREKLKMQNKEPLVKKSEIKKTKKPNDPHTYHWTEDKARILISSILEGTREGRGLMEILDEVSQNIGISASACQSYWYNKAPKQYKEEFKQIKSAQENWSAEEVQLLDHLISVEYAHLTPLEVLPIASQRLKKHIDVVRRKLFSLLREKQGDGVRGSF
ncbi:helix-turn-helix domain-containing protein [Bacillus sp. FJAT-29814]|uniref:helix-turn-helix domain-containing protein n=1 Tax=Bacillus sp. FJAT-29814 TaxID=1729688 RepID=UPI000834DAAD|nr:helix-turn-helix domain-containing protein [Bacillus sp. FJAT-29814]